MAVGQGGDRQVRIFVSLPVTYTGTVHVHTRLRPVRTLRAWNQRDGNDQLWGCQNALGFCKSLGDASGVAPLVRDNSQLHGFGHPFEESVGGACTDAVVRPPNSWDDDSVLMGRPEAM
jgi:hypothetical protein